MCGPATRVVIVVDRPSTITSIFCRPTKNDLTPSGSPVAKLQKGGTQSGPYRPAPRCLTKAEPFGLTPSDKKLVGGMIAKEDKGGVGVSFLRSATGQTLGARAAGKEGTADGDF